MPLPERLSLAGARRAIFPASACLLDPSPPARHRETSWATPRPTPRGAADLDEAKQSDRRSTGPISYNAGDRSGVTVWDART